MYLWEQRGGSETTFSCAPLHQVKLILFYFCIFLFLFTLPPDFFFFFETRFEEVCEVTYVVWENKKFQFKE